MSYTQGKWGEGRWISGEWRAPMRDDSMTTTARIIRSECGKAVAMAVTSYEAWKDKKADEEMRANARLIAAAPELLEALQELEDVASFIHVEDRRERRHLSDALEKARAAISRALGENKE